MKKLILSLSIAAFFAACSNPATTETTSVATTQQPDTSGLAAFNSWKEQQAAFEMQGVNEVPVQAERIEQPQPAPVIVYREAPAKKRAVAAAPAPAPKRTVARSSNPVRQSSHRNQVPASTNPDLGPGTSTSDAGVGTGTGTGAGTGDVATAPQPAKKEGWSKAAQGTAIGGASGAVVGAIISKNKTKGAIIGGVVGAAGGYVLGRSKDKKDGRY
ncbi:YMGG-like glycine zipper-containing protein [Aridibaculum aurantiacum]|uniref:YMGG-like glycine zipper-containing protein n=1 Tax=Aridibaculum aurantiacum TaxID=2810307 RepID=UPI001A972005|nr:YMGG-like glycine zipper-containing protein [Aridibaculum aurantiacum]